MISRRGQVGTGVGLSSATFSAGEAAPTPSTQYLLDLLNLALDPGLPDLLDEDVVRVAEGVEVLAPTNNQVLG